MPTINIEQHIDVHCRDCLGNLSGQTTTMWGPTRDRPLITVVPCPDCLEQARQNGYNDGYKQGVEDA